MSWNTRLLRFTFFITFAAALMLCVAAVAQDTPQATEATEAAEQIAEEATEANEPAAEASAASQEETTEQAAEPATQPAAEPAEAPAAEEAKPIEEAAENETTEEAAEETSEEPAAPATDWAGLTERFPEFFAVTHHATIHLPIALWLFGALFVVIGWVAPSWRNQVPLACLIGGAVTSVAAVASGWWYAEFEWGADWTEVDWSEHLVKHRWVGVGLLVSSVVLSIIALISQAKQSFKLGVIWRLGLIVLAAVVAWEGHLGGELIQGEGFFEEALEAWLNPEG